MSSGGGDPQLRYAAQHACRPGIAVALSSRMTIAARYFNRFVGALALDPDAYESVEADRAATPAALATVVLSATATGVGMSAVGGAEGVATLTAIALLAWALWALLVFEVGARLLPTALTRVDVGQLLRTIGFASAPGVLNLLGIFPGVGVPVFTVTQIWILLAIIVAVRQALDYTSTARAVAVCVIAWAIATALALASGVVLSGAGG